jgi:hypothetical protein
MHSPAATTLRVRAISGVPALPSPPAGRGGAGAMPLAAHHPPPQQPPPPTKSSSTAAAGGRRPARSCCAGCCCTACACCRVHPRRACAAAFLAAAAVAAAAYFLFPRTDITFAFPSPPRTAVQHFEGATGVLGAAVPVLPFFSAVAAVELRVRNPNWVPFSLTLTELAVRHVPAPAPGAAAGAAGDTSQPLLTLLQTGQTLRVPAGSPSRPGVGAFVLYACVGMEDGGMVNPGEALACSEDMYGAQGNGAGGAGGAAGGCRVHVRVGVQPTYLGLGAGIIPVQTLTFTTRIMGARR